MNESYFCIREDWNLARVFKQIDSSNQFIIISMKNEKITPLKSSVTLDKVDLDRGFIKIDGNDDNYKNIILDWKKLDAEDDNKLIDFISKYKNEK